MGSPLFMKSLSKILLPLLIMLWLNSCMSINTQIVGQTYQPLEPQEVHVFTLKEFIEIILEKRKCEQLAYIKIKNIPREKNCRKLKPVPPCEREARESKDFGNKR